MWDTVGQLEFHVTHSMFLTAASINKMYRAYTHKCRDNVVPTTDVQVTIYLIMNSVSASHCRHRYSLQLNVTTFYMAINNQQLNANLNYESPISKYSNEKYKTAARQLDTDIIAFDLQQVFSTPYILNEQVFYMCSYDRLTTSVYVDITMTKPLGMEDIDYIMRSRGHQYSVLMT